MPTPRGTIFLAPDDRFRFALHGSGMTTKAGERSTGDRIHDRGPNPRPGPSPRSGPNPRRLFFEASAAAIAGHPPQLVIPGRSAALSQIEPGIGMAYRTRNRFRIAPRASGMTTKAGERSTWTEDGA